jgi:uncharacterized lipoprotein YddW (UPF0748 family)
MGVFSRACWLAALVCVLVACVAAPTSVSAESGVPPQFSMRGVWIASVAHIDWPSKAGLTPAQSRAELIGWYDMAVANKLNAVFVQVRPTADAFWPSSFEPWSVWLTGTQGQNPGWDPLAFAVAEAHRRGLQFHAWMNPYRVTMSGGVDQLVPTHPARLHPNWTVSYNNQVLYNPGMPEVRRFVEEAMLDAVKRYDIDGLHWDDYFYPYPSPNKPFNDDAAFAAYGGGFANRADWRRNNVDTLVLEMQQRIKALKPHVKFGISPFAVWRNIATDPSGSNTTAGCETFDDLYADTRGWVRKEWIDYIAPQIYWSIGFSVADYAVLLPWWAETVRGTNVELYVGEAVYRVGTPGQGDGWLDPEQLSRQLALGLNTAPELDGHIYFSAKDVRANKLNAMKMAVQKFYNFGSNTTVSEVEHKNKRNEKKLKEKIAFI